MVMQAMRRTFTRAYGTATNMRAWGRSSAWGSQWPFVMPAFEANAAEAAAAFRAQAARLAKYPMAASATICGAKTCAADIMVQKVWEKQPEIDYRRNFVFTIFGLVYLGAFQYIQYTFWLPRWFPGKSLRSSASCVAFDQLINTPVWYYPLFYVVQDAVMTASLAWTNVTVGLERYKNNIVTDVTTCWKVWVPAQLFNFYVMPLQCRAIFAAGVSFGWTCILSSLRGAI
mmetsp:Transcript_49528/g.117902  ORF Transcript_49528/g.117902 Transcript_49528/m.117902 type:complete len:229 (+) Transcript_49528:84-770(+)